MCSCTGSCDCNSITVPRGPQGEKGDTGSQGIQGIQGPIGLTGSIGPQGPSGVVNVEAPVTNTGTPTSAIIGVDINELVTLINTSNAGVGFIPTGAIVAFSALTPPTGWATCVGQEVLKTGVYAELYAVIGDTYGTPSGVDTFILPNLKTKVPVGYDFTTPLFNTMGNFGGSTATPLSQANLPLHTHGNTFAVTGSGSHDHYSRQTVSIGEGGSDFKVAKIDADDNGDGGSYIINSVLSGSNGAHTHNISGTILDGSGTFLNTPVTNMQPYLVINYIIKL
jgi:microcystin-dependent protein